MSEKVAGAREVREEDAFDTAAVSRWLDEDITEVQQFSAGASNLTYLLRTPERDLILRRPPAGTKAASAHDMGREYRIQSALKPVFPYVPEMIGHCEDESVIGSPFYVMERLDGVIPRKASQFPLSPEQARVACTNTIDLLVDLHSVDAAAVGLDDLGKGCGYVGRQVAGWSDRYRKSRTWNVPSWEKTMAWLDANQPADVRTCLIHNDFRIDNVVYAADDLTRPIGLLDWEMATLGDPLMDLGGALAYWVQADDNPPFSLFKVQPSYLPGMLTRDEVVAYYCERAGITLDEGAWAFYEVFGLFRLAVIVQQIYYRYHHKQTRNPKFKHFWLVNQVLARRAASIVRKAS